MDASNKQIDTRLIQTTLDQKSINEENQQDYEHLVSHLVEQDT